MTNPYRQFLDDDQDVLQPGPQPGLAERFMINFEAGQRMNTVLGAVADAVPEHRDDRRRFDTRYDAFPEWQGFLEGSTALAGQLLGTAASPENFIPIGLGAQVVAGSKMAVTGLWARVFAGAVDGAAVNAAADLAIQGVENVAGHREGFDPAQYGAGVLLGGVIGGAGGAVARGLEVRRERRAAGESNPYATMVEDTAREAAPAAAEGAPAVHEAAASAAMGEKLSAEAAAVRRIAPTHEGPVGPVYAADAFDDWAAAVAHLSRVKEGEIAGMLSHPEVGPIDVVWGRYDPDSDDGAGLAKILAKHPEVVGELPALIEGMTVASRTSNRIRLESPDHLAVVRLDYDGEEKTWLMTAFEKGRRAGETTDRPGSLQADGHSSSASPADPNISARARSGNDEDVSAMVIGQSRAAKAAARAQAEAESFMAISPRLAGTMAGERARPSAGIARTAQAAVQAIDRVRATAEALAAALDVAATRQGRLPRIRGVQGVYKHGSGAVRVRSLDDFDVISHEYGHHIEKRVPGMTALMRAHRAELAKLDYDPLAGRPAEGFAEFFRLWLTNRPYARKAAPRFAAAFEAELVKHPEIGTAIDAASSAWSDFLAAPSSIAVSSTIVSSRKKGWIAGASDAFKKNGLAGTIHDVLQRSYTNLFDDLNPLARAVDALKAIHFSNTGKVIDLPVGSDAYKLARMSRGAYAAGHMDVMYGVAPYRGLNPASPSLRDAIVEATGKPNALSGWDDARVTDFASYLWSRRALGEWARFENGDIPNPPDKLTKGDHEVNVAEMEAANPQFASAAAKVHQFSHALWQKKHDAGLIDQTTYEDGLKIVDYVPGLRDWQSSDTDMKVPGGRSKGKTARGGFARRFLGSKRDVINPLESLAADAYETAMAIARNDIVKALDRLAMTAGPGGGAIAERIPARELKGAMIDPLEAVESAARNAGLSRPDIIALRDAVESAIGEEKAAIFRPAIINEKGEPIVFFRDGGQLQALRLADGAFGKDMYRVLSAMSAPEKNFFLEMLAMPARVLRMGITTSLDFIGANFVRDQVMAGIYYGRPFRRVGRTLQGAADDLLGSDAARQYARVYGLSGGQETASLSRSFAERDISALKRKGWTAQRLTSFRGVLQIAETAETATRLGLFRTFVEEARARGLDEMEAALEASWRARDYIDFDRRGSSMGALARLIPFLNVSLQGVDKAARHVIAPLAKKVLGQPLSAEDGRALGMAAKSWARLAALLTASMSLYALMSRHEDHDEVSENTRALHWMVKWGEKWVAVPKPHELAMPINLAEATFDAMVKKDPAAYGRWVDSLYYTLMPPDIATGNPAIATYFEVKTNTSFFTGAPIVPEHMQGMEPFLQYTARTSALSRQLGEAFNVSPAIADHLLTAHLGSWGRNLLSLYDLAQPDAPAPRWDDVPIARRFVKDAAKGAQSVTMFWKLAGEREGMLEGAVRSWRFFAESGDAAAAADYYAKQDDVAKAYIALSGMEAKARRLHPIVRARGGIRAIGAIRRDMAAGRLETAAGETVMLSPAARTAADDVLSSLSMAMARNGLMLAGVPGWAQREEIDESGFLREIEAISPALLQRLGDGFTTGRVWSYEAVKEAWPELRSRVLTDGSAAPVLDLVVGVEAAGPAVQGLRIRRRERPGVELD